MTRNSYCKKLYWKSFSNKTDLKRSEFSEPFAIIVNCEIKGQKSVRLRIFWLKYIYRKTDEQSVVHICHDYVFSLLSFWGWRVRKSVNLIQTFDILGWFKNILTFQILKSTKYLQAIKNMFITNSNCADLISFVATRVKIIWIVVKDTYYWPTNFLFNKIVLQVSSISLVVFHFLWCFKST